MNAKKKPTGGIVRDDRYNTHGEHMTIRAFGFNHGESPFRGAPTHVEGALCESEKHGNVDGGL